MLKDYDKEYNIHDAFRDYVYYKTGWKIVYDGKTGEYVGKTKERYEIFRFGWLCSQGYDPKKEYLN